MLGEFVKETLELDSRFLRTVKTMIMRPGELSAEFSRNRRGELLVTGPLLPVRQPRLLLRALADDGSQSAGRAVGTRRRSNWAGRAREADVERLKSMLPEEQRGKIDAILAHPGRPYLKIVVYEAAKALAAAGDDFVLDGFDRFVAVQVVDVMHQPLVAVDRLMDNLPIAMFVTLPAYAGLLALF